VQTNGWTAADEFELIMRRWRATLDRGKMGEITVGKRKADACKKHSHGSRSTERMPSQVVEAIWNVTAAQLSPDPVRSAVMECTDPDNSKRAAALKARTYRRGDGVDDSAGTDDDISAAINQYLSTCDRSRRGSTEPWTEQEDRVSAPCLLALAGRPYRSAQIGSHRLGPRRACHRASSEGFGAERTTTSSSPILANHLRVVCCKSSPPPGMYVRATYIEKMNSGAT